MFQPEEALAKALDNLSSEDWEKKELISKVIKVATEAMFTHHFYTFKGEKFRQNKGGPIGLRGTCAVTRVVMQLFDQKWGLKIRDLGLVTWLVGRYMDGIRVFLPPTKIGWRMWEGKLQYCKKWAIQDQN